MTHIQSTLQHPATLLLVHFFQDESGQDLIEYALLASLVALGAVSSSENLAVQIANQFNNIASTLTDAASPPSNNGHGDGHGDGHDGHH